MQNRLLKRLKIILIFILFVESCLIKYGTCAPRKTKLVKNDPQKVKRSAGFMNYLSSMFYRTSYNHPDTSWNFYEPQSPESNYEANSIQYLDESENNIQDENYINNWPENDLKQTSYVETFPNYDAPIYLTNIDRDNSFTSMMENDCDHDRNSLENDLNWKYPPQGIDESMFYNFYFLPEEDDFSGPITTERPIDQSTQNWNKVEEEKTPNVSIFNCSSSPAQKEFLENVLSNNNDEYMVLLIKRNPFLGNTKEENKPETEVVLQLPPDDQTEFETRSKNTTSSTVDIKEDTDLVLQNNSNEYEEPSEAIDQIENKFTGTLDLVLKHLPKQESSTEIPTSLVSTSITNQEEADVDLQQNNEKTTEEILSSTINIGEQITDGTKLGLDLHDMTSTGSSITSAASTVSTPIEEQIDPRISIKQENGNSVPTASQIEITKSIVNITNEESAVANTQTVKNEENQIKVETVEKTLATNNFAEEKLEASETPKNDSKSMKDNKDNLVHETIEEIIDTNSKEKKEVLIENLEEQQKQDSVDVLNSVISVGDPAISEEFPTSDTPSAIENVPLETEEHSEGGLFSTLSNPTQVQDNSESPMILEDSIVPVTSKYIKSNEDQKIEFLKPIENLEAKEIAESQEDIGLLKLEENNFDSISGTSTTVTYPVDNSDT